MPVPVYELFTSTELLGKMALERMLAVASTRRHPVAEDIDEQARSTSERVARAGYSDEAGCARAAGDS